MKVLILHNRYQQAGGEDTVVRSENDLLHTHGHQSVVSAVGNEGIISLVDKARAALDICYSKYAKSKVIDDISRHAPDIVHVHNFFPLLTPSIYDACRFMNVPVVQTLHNYRITCAGALLMRDGKVCEECLTASPYHAVRFRCYRNSFIGSAAVATMIDYHRRRQTWKTRVDAFIALTEFSKRKFVEAGVPEPKIFVKPNFVSDGRTTTEFNAERAGALFVGRLTPEKGVKTLLEAWKALSVPLKLAGTGPLESKLPAMEKTNIKFLGQIAPADVVNEMRRASMLVMPSEWYEGFPMVLVEAFNNSLPVIASRLGGMSEIVEDGVTGLHFEAGNANDLAAKVTWLSENPALCRRMGENARKVYEEKYTSSRNYTVLMNIYQRAIEIHANG